MFGRFIIPATLGLTALAALVPGTASAQNYDGWYGRAYPDSAYGERYEDRYQGRSNYYDRDSYRARQRWIEHRRWEQEARRRYWQRQRWEQARERRDWDDDGRGW